MDNRVQFNKLEKQIESIITSRDSTRTGEMRELIQEYENLKKTIDKENEIMAFNNVNKDDFYLTARLAYMKDGHSFQDKLDKLLSKHEGFDGGRKRKRTFSIRRKSKKVKKYKSKNM